MIDELTPELEYVLLESGYGRFDGKFDAVMKPNGSFQLPEDWNLSLDEREVYMVFDEIAGEICVYFAGDEPNLDGFEDYYSGVSQRFNAYAPGFIKRRHLNPYQHTYPFDRLSDHGVAKINPYLMRGNRDFSYTKVFSEDPFDIQMEGRGHYFTISRADGTWKRDKSVKGWQMEVNWHRVCSLYPLLQDIRKPREYSAVQRELLPKAHLSVPEQNQTDQPSDDVLGVRLPK